MKIQGESDMEAAAIRLENVSFGYHGSQVLREINFSVQKGEHIGIVGTSGCGKSLSLIHIFQLCVEKPGLYGDIVAGRDPGNSGGFH